MPKYSSAAQEARGSCYWLPLLTRLYSPTDFGSLAVLTAFSAVIAVLATLRWEAGIVLPQRDTDAKALGWLALGSAALISFFAYVSTQLWPAAIEVFAGTGAASMYSWILPVTIMAISFHKVLSAWMVRKEQFVRLGQRNFLVGFGQLCVQLGLGALGIKPIGLLLGLAGGGLLEWEVLSDPKVSSLALDLDSRTLSV
ncbi:lipopolysaccharide biosynthesis protein [Arthrobacter sp. SA17]